MDIVTEDDVKIIPQELVTMIVHRAIGTKPFDKTEISWLTINSSNIGILYYYNGDSITFIYKKTNRGFNYAASKFYYESVTNIAFNYNQTTSEGEYLMIRDCQLDIPGEEIIEDLTERLDSRIYKTIYATPLKRDLDLYTCDGGQYEDDITKDREELKNGYEYPANIILLDLISMYKIFYKRFNILYPDEAIALAKKFTIEAFNNIVDDFITNNQYINSPSLMSYMDTNANIFSEIFKSEFGYFTNSDEFKNLLANEYFFGGPTIINESYLQFIEHACSVYYDFLMKTINLFSTNNIPVKN